MTEENNQSQVQTRKLSNCAKISFFFAVGFWVIHILFVISALIVPDILDSYEFNERFRKSLFFSTTIPSSTLLIISILIIIIKRKTSKGWIFVILSFILNAPVVAFPITYAWKEHIDHPLIHRAAYAGDTEKVRKLLKKKPQLANAEDIYSETPLHHALRGGHLDIAELLIENDSNVNDTGGKGWTPLQLAFIRRGGCDCNEQIIELLVNKGADVNAEPCPFFSAPLIEAIEFRHCSFEVIKILIEHGADIHYLAYSDRSILDIAIKSNRKDVIELLLSHGAKRASEITVKTVEVNDSSDDVNQFQE